LFLFDREAMRFDLRTVRSLASVGSSTLAEQLFMRIGFFTYVRIVAGLGTSEFAAYQIGMNLMNLSFSFGDGLSAAAIALVGRSLGAGRPDLAKIYGGVCQRIGVLFSTMISLVFLTMGRALFRLFTDDEAVLSYSPMLLSVLCVVVFLQIAQVIFTACLRAGGDTLYTALVALISITFVRPGMGWLLCYPVGLGLTGAWLGLAIDQLVRFLLTFTRFHSGHWTRKRL
ncbi:MAG: MATE family efflux transporter, partial [Oscillospiraceae bacterium]